MIDMTLAELLTGLDLSDDEVADALKSEKQDGLKPEAKPAPAPGEEKPKQR